MTRASGPPAAHPLEIARAFAGTLSGNERLRDIAVLLAGADDTAARTWSIVLRGGLAPLAAHAFAQHDLLTMFDAPMRSALRSAFEVNALRNAMLRRAAAEASRALASRGIDPLWVKGLWLAHYIYDLPALRTMSDIDLVVPVGRRREAADALLALGYVHDSAANHEGAATWTDTVSRPLDLPDGATSLHIDLHDEIRVSAERTWPAERLWHAATAVRISGAAVCLPKPEAGLLYLAMHLFKHGFDLRHAVVATVDAATLLRKQGTSLDIPWLEQRLSDPRDATALYMLLSHVGVQPTPSAQLLFERTRRRVAALGLVARADALLASAAQLPFSGMSAFSLFDVGEEAGPWKTMARLARGSLRYRRRLQGISPGETHWPGSLPWQFTRANLRYAYTTYLAGRLSARLDTPTASSPSPRPRSGYRARS